MRLLSYIQVKSVLQFQSDEGCFTLNVKDNGIGFPPEIDIKNPQKLGLQLVNFINRPIRR